MLRSFNTSLCKWTQFPTYITYQPHTQVSFPLRRVFSQTSAERCVVTDRSSSRMFQLLAKQIPNNLSPFVCGPLKTSCKNLGPGRKQYVTRISFSPSSLVQQWAPSSICGGRVCENHAVRKGQRSTVPFILHSGCVPEITYYGFMPSWSGVVARQSRVATLTLLDGDYVNLLCWRYLPLLTSW